MEKKTYWRGVKGVTMIWHGEWADPELVYKGCYANYWAVEDSLFEMYKIECLTSKAYVLDDNQSEFNRFCQDYAEQVYELIEFYSE